MEELTVEEFFAAKRRQAATDRERSRWLSMYARIDAMLAAAAKPYLRFPAADLRREAGAPEDADAWLDAGFRSVLWVPVGEMPV